MKIAVVSVSTSLQHALKLANYFISTKTSAVLMLSLDSIYTTGRRGNAEERSACSDSTSCRAESIPIMKLNRGGCDTWHGPGQLVAFPIINLQQQKLSVHQYVDKLERVVIDTLNHYGIQGAKGIDARHTGVWV